MKIATKLTKRVAEFVLEVSGVDYINDINDFYFNYPNDSDGMGFKKGFHLKFEGIKEGYTKVSEQEFIDMVTAELSGNNKSIEMKTKCIVLGQENEPKKELKKIELKECLQSGTGNFSDLMGIGYNGDFHSHFSELALNHIYKIKGMDVIFATKRTDKGVQVWLGHWNDGVV